VLRRAGYEVDPIDSGCCGMAGSFGYEAEHYSMSRAIGDVLVDQVEDSDGDRTVAPGASCRSQLESYDDHPDHPAELLREAMAMWERGQDAPTPDGVDVVRTGDGSEAAEADADADGRPATDAPRPMGEWVDVIRTDDAGDGDRRRRPTTDDRSAGTPAEDGGRPEGSEAAEDPGETADDGGS